VEKLLPSVREPELRQRLLLVRADRLEALGRHAEAAAQRADAGGIEPEPESVVVIDLAGDDDGDAEPNVPHDPGPQPEPEAGPEAEAEPELEPEPEPEPELEPEAEPELEPEPEAEP